MKKRTKVCWLLPLLGSSMAYAEPQSPQYSVSMAGLISTDSDLDAGGELSRREWQLGASGNWQLAQTWQVAADIGMSQLDWDWQLPAALAAATVFDSAKRYHLGLRLNRQLSSQWSLIVSPRVQMAYANDADAWDSKSYGVIAGAVRRYQDGDFWGLGAAYFNDIGKVRMLPLLMFNWQIDEHWRLGNPRMPDFSGGAGLELTYALSPAVEWGVGSSRNDERIMVNQQQQVLELSEYRLFTRVGWQAADNINLNVYLGYSLGGEVEWHDPDVTSTDLDNTLAGGIQLRWSF